MTPKTLKHVLWAYGIRHVCNRKGNGRVAQMVVATLDDLPVETKMKLKPLLEQNQVDLSEAAFGQSTDQMHWRVLIMFLGKIGKATESEAEAEAFAKRISAALGYNTTPAEYVAKCKKLMQKLEPGDSWVL